MKMPTASKESIVVVKELPTKRDPEHTQHRSRRKIGTDDKNGEKRRTRSSASENKRHATDVTVPFFWRWVSNTGDAIKKEPTKERRPPSGQRTGSHTSLGHRSEHKRKLADAPSRGDRGPKAATVTRDSSDRPLATRRSSHPLPKSATASSTSRPSLHRSKTTTRADHPTTDSSSINKAERREKPPSSTEKSKRPSSVLGNTIRPKKPVKMAECVSCMDNVPAKKGVYLKFCQHHWCESCIKNVFDLSMKDIAQMPPKCCKNKPIQPTSCGHLFDTKFRAAWNRKFEEWSAKDRLYCPRKGCGTWIKPENIKEDKKGNKIYGECSKCKKKVCPKCNGNYHPKKPECPKDAQIDDFIKTAKENGWQQCPECGITVERTEGCNHMTCPPPCNHQFCIVCAKKWKTCDCPWFGQQEIDRLRAGGVHVDGNGPVQPPPQTYTEEMARRREQEQQDEEFARRMQMMGMDDDNDDDDGPAAMNPFQNPFMAQQMAAAGGGAWGQQQMNSPFGAGDGPFGMNMQQGNALGGNDGPAVGMHAPQTAPDGTVRFNITPDNPWGYTREQVESMVDSEMEFPVPKPFMPLRLDNSFRPERDTAANQEYLDWEFWDDLGYFDHMPFPYGHVGAPPPTPMPAPLPPNAGRDWGGEDFRWN